MYYIIMDLEWNNAFVHRTKSFMNEIIEVGAVMLNEELEEISEFSCFVKSRIGKKIRSNIKKLTHITNDDMRSGDEKVRGLDRKQGERYSDMGQ